LPGIDDDNDGRRQLEETRWGEILQKYMRLLKMESVGYTEFRCECDFVKKGVN